MHKTPIAAGNFPPLRPGRHYRESLINHLKQNRRRKMANSPPDAKQTEPEDSRTIWIIAPADYLPFRVIERDQPETYTNELLFIVYPIDGMSISAIVDARETRQTNMASPAQAVKKMSKALQESRCVCIRCGHAWQLRTAKLPKQCPMCHSVLWNTPSVRNMAKSRLPVWRGKGKRRT